MASAKVASVLLTFTIISLGLSTAHSQDPGKAVKEKPADSATTGIEKSSSTPAHAGSDWIWRSDEARIHNKIEILRGIAGAEGRHPPIMINCIRFGSIPIGPEGFKPEKFYKLLKQSENLRRELGMTESQIARFKRICSDYDKSFNAAVIRSESKMTGKESREEHRELIAKKMDDLQAVQQSFYEATSELLTGKQVERLDQIALQIRGPLAVSHPKIAELIDLTEEQFAEVKQIVEDMMNKQTYTLETAFKASQDPNDPFHYRPLPPDPAKPKTEDPKAEAKKAGSDAGSKDATAPPKPEASKNRKEETAKRLDWASLRLEVARNAAIARISKCLSRQQKTAFNQLLGRRVSDLADLVPDDFTIPHPNSASIPPTSPPPPPPSSQKK